MRRSLFYILVLSFIFNLNIVSFSYAISNDEINGLINDLKTYFLDYYRKAIKGEVESQEKVLAKLKSIIKNNLGETDLTKKFQRIDNFFQLTQWLNSKFNEDNSGKVKSYGINIFLSPISNIVNCWLGKNITVENLHKHIWDKDIGYQLIMIRNLFVHDYLYYISNGNKELEIVNKNNVIFCNREAFLKKANARWQFLLSHYKSKKAYKNYNPSKVDKLRRKLLTKTWEDSFLKIIKENDLNKAREVFLNSVEGKLLKIAVIHELGHIYADEYLSHSNDLLSEIVALLTELAFGPMPDESLNTVLSFAWKSHWKTYRFAGQYIIRNFVKEVEEGSCGRKMKLRVTNNIKGMLNKSLINKEEMICFLNQEQIRELANIVFKNRI
jgi:hypothetical protein